jgi:feruloyl esterase
MGAIRAGQTIRLFTMPNVDHVGFGAPANVDLVQALEGWVQRKAVPQNLVALEQEVSVAAKTIRSLPLCEYPMYPHYQGKGDVSKSESYSCMK